LANLSRRLGEVRSTLLPGETLQLACGLLRLFGDLALSSGGVAIAELVRHRLACPLILSLQTTREFPHPLGSGIDLRLALLIHLRCRTLDRLVLILELIQLQTEQVGQVLCRGAATPASAAATTLLPEPHLPFTICRLGTLRLQQRPLLGRQRIGCLHATKLLRCLRHLGRRQRESLRDRAEGGILANPSIGQPLCKRDRLLLQLLL